MDNADFEYLKQKFKHKDTDAIIRTLTNTPKEIKAKLSIEDFEEVLSYYYGGKIAKEAITDLLEKKASGEKVKISEFEAVSEEQLEKEIKKIIGEKPGLNMSAYMGLVMAKYRGRADGRKVMEMVKKLSG